MYPQSGVVECHALWDPEASITYSPDPSVSMIHFISLLQVLCVLTCNGQNVTWFYFCTLSLLFEFLLSCEYCFICIPDNMSVL